MLSISSTNSLALFLFFCVSSMSIKTSYFKQDTLVMPYILNEKNERRQVKKKKIPERQNQLSRWKDEKMRCNVSCMRAPWLQKNNLYTDFVKACWATHSQYLYVCVFDTVRNNEGLWFLLLNSVPVVLSVQHGALLPGSPLILHF